MSYKTVFVPMMFEDRAEAVLTSALKIAAHFKAHVHAKHIRQQYEFYPPVTYYPMAVDFPVMTGEKQAEAASAFARSLRAIFDTTCDAHDAHIVPLSEALHQNGVTASWADSSGVLPSDFGHAARVADLAIVSLPEEHAVLQKTIFESLLMQSGRPVLVVPHAGLEHLPQRILVAWDGSLPVARALQLATPFLDDAKEVHIITIGEVDAGMPSGQAAAAYLTRRGAIAKATTVDWPKKPIAERILNQAEAHNCDMIVMGGYSHARFYESLLGGVTHHMLAHADRALLMAH